MQKWTATVLTDSNFILHHERPYSRRDFLHRAGCGFGSLAFWGLLSRETALARATTHGGGTSLVNPLSEKSPEFAAKAKSVIWCFMDGGPSHLDLFDPKPTLNKLAGQLLPASFPRPMTAMGKTAFTPLMGSRRKFTQHGQSGIWVSDWYPEIADCADDMAVIRSCWADGLTHVGSVCEMNTGSILLGRPCFGSWLLYGLGTSNENLPGYVVLTDYQTEPPGGSRQWSTGFMPSTYQGTKFRDVGTPILNVGRYVVTRNDVNGVKSITFSNSIANI